MVSMEERKGDCDDVDLDKESKSSDMIPAE